MAETKVKITELNTTTIGSAIITSNFTGGQGTNNAYTDITGLSATAVVPFNTSLVEISTNCTVYNNSAAARIDLRLSDGTNIIQYAHTDVAAANSVNTIYFKYIGTFTAGTHVFKLAESSNIAGPNIQAQSTEPAQLFIKII